MNSLLSSSFKVSSEISLIRTEFFVTLQTHTNTVPLTFLWHRFGGTDHKTFSFFYFSLSSNRAFFAFYLKSKNHHEKRAKQRTQTLCEHRIVECSRSWFSRSRRNCDSDRWWASCHHPRKWTCRTHWAHNLCLHLTWPSSQTYRCKCRVAHVLRFQDGKVRQDHVDGIVSEVVVGSGLEVTVREQQRRVKHETGDGGEKDTRATNTFFTNLSHACMWHAWEVQMWMCTRSVQKNVRAVQQASARTLHSRRTHCSRYYMCTKP